MGDRPKMLAPVHYLHLLPGGQLPLVSHFLPSRMVVIAEMDVAPAWRALVSSWLVRSGCLCMMAWGERCDLWDDVVDWTLLEEFGFGDIPAERFVMTSWHEGQTLDEVFAYCKQLALFDSVPLAQTVLLHVAKQSAEQQIMDVYAQA